MAREFGLGIMAYSPLAIGLLTGRFRRGQTPPEDSPWGNNPRPGLSRTEYPFVEAMTEQLEDTIQSLVDIGKKYEKTPAQGALAWILDRGKYLVPIPGTRSASHLKEWVGATEIIFSDEDRTEIKRILPVGFAHGDRYSDEQIVGIERYC